MLRLGGRMMVPKFRVWDETQNKMLQVDCIEFIDGKAYWVEASPANANGNVQGGNDGPIGDNSQLKLEQYTGLKDANGKEIYECDILATSSMVCGSHVTDYLKVDWREDYAGFFCGETPLFACLSEWDNDIKYPQTFPEIVGNVHTNPELLEAQHDTRTD